jgi:hypothetical protein
MKLWDKANRVPCTWLRVGLLSFAVIFAFQFAWFSFTVLAFYFYEGSGLQGIDIGNTSIYYWTKIYRPFHLYFQGFFDVAAGTVPSHSRDLGWRFYAIAVLSMLPVACFTGIFASCVIDIRNRLAVTRGKPNGERSGDRT